MTEKSMMFHPSILPETADPEGSIRYNCIICHEKMFSLNSQTFFYNAIKDKGLFIVEEHNPEYKKYETSFFKGVVLKGANGEYSWWKE